MCTHHYCIKTYDDKHAIQNRPNKIPSSEFFCAHKTILMCVISIRPGKPRDLILTNILEEGSSVDEPRSFEQDEQYLDECLKMLEGNPEELQVNTMICRIILHSDKPEYQDFNGSISDFKTMSSLTSYYEF